MNEYSIIPWPILIALSAASSDFLPVHLFPQIQITVPKLPVPLQDLICYSKNSFSFTAILIISFLLFLYTCNGSSFILSPILILWFTPGCQYVRLPSEPHPVSSSPSHPKGSYFVLPIWASLVAQLVKNLPAVQETWLQPLGWEDPLEKGKATQLQYSCVENSMARGACWATVHGVSKSWTELSD